MDRSNAATVQPFARYALAASLAGGLFLPALAYAAKTSKTAPTPAAAQPAAVKKPAPVVMPPGPVFADPFPSPPSEIGSDLLPTEQDASKSEAFVRYALALIAEDSGDDEEAVRSLYSSALDLDPGNTGLASRIAATLLKEEKPADAVRILKNAHQASPREPGPAIDLARIYLGALRQADSALTYAERAFKLAPEDFTALSTFVEVCAAGRLPQRIDETLRKTLAQPIQDANFWLRAGDLFRNALSPRGQPPGKSQVERLNALYKKALELEPSSLACLERSADHYTLTQQYAEACRFYERANTLYSKENNGHSLSVCQKWARALVLNEQPDAAIELLEETIRQNPSAADPRELAGELYLQQGQLVSALSHFKIALDLGGARLEDHVRLVQLQLRLKRGDEAVENAVRARKAFPEAPGVTMLLAVALGEARRHQEAVQAFEMAEQEFLKIQTEGLDASFYLTYGAAAERAGMVEQAAKLLQKSISIDPENAAEALNYLGFMWVDRNVNLEEAGALIRRALGLRPNHPAYLDSLGWWHYRKGDLPAAVRELRRALEKIRREEAPEVYDHLGEVQERLGNPAEAINAWEAALELDPSLESVKEKIQRLRNAAPQQ